MNKRKATTTLIVVLICLILTIGTTVGIVCYNYYGYVGYKMLYFYDYLDQENKLASNQEKIERMMKWETVVYNSKKANISYRDPISKQLYTDSVASLSPDAFNQTATFSENVLHTEYFDIHFYIAVSSTTDSDGKFAGYSVSQNFYFSNIDYNKIKDYEPQYIYATFVDGIGEESDEALKKALEEMQENEASSGNVSTVSAYSYMNKDGSTTLSTYGLIDNARDVFKDEGNVEYYIYQNRCSKSYDNNTKFSESKGLTFSIYYMNDSENGDKKLINLVEGTYKPNLNAEDKVFTGEDWINDTDSVKGYDHNIYNETYNAFIKPRLIKTAIITFVVAGIISVAFGFVWLYEPKQTKK